MKRVDSTSSVTPLRQGTSRRRGYTLAEIVVVLTILAILLSITIVSSRAILDSRARSSAQSQIALIAAGIEKYASFWPRLEIGGVVVADRAWPDPFAVRVFNTSIFDVDAPFNTRTQFAIEGAGSGLIEDLVNFSQSDRVVSDDGTGGDVMAGNACLAHALLSRTGRGPYLEADDAGAMVKSVAEVDPGTAHRVLPSISGRNENKPALVLVDPWGTPYRYFWVYRDATALRGYLPVTTANLGDPSFRKAVGFVLESAGPDRKFGDVWVVGTPPNVDFNEASDNIIITP